MLFLLACSGSEDDTAAPPAPEPEYDVHVTVAPTRADFGAVAYGSEGETAVTLTNTGEGTVRVVSASVNKDDVAVIAPLAVPIPPGTTLDVPLTWTPSTTASLSADLSLALQDDSGPSGSLTIPVAGTVDAPELTVSSETVDFGTVSAGCSSTVSLVLENTGTQSLTVTGLDFEEPVDEYSLSIGGVSALPWVPIDILPGESTSVDVAFTPMTEATTLADLTITSTDPIAPTLGVGLTGTGQIDGEGEVVYLTEEKNVTVLVAVNAVAVFSRDWETSIPVLFETLGDSRAHWRLAFLTETSGEVVGNTPYIDDSMDLDEALDVMDEQLANTGGDNDYLLQTFDLGIEANRDWLVDDSDAWYNSTLNLIAMNSDVEQSTQPYKMYVSDYRSYKADPGDVYVHAITGEQPSGCNENGLFAEPSGGLEQAAYYTGGVFVSWCEDWATSMETIADAALSGTQRFTLDEEPDPASVAVQIDGVTLDEGWWYDEDGNEVLFEEGYFPALGSEVRITWWTAHSCD